MITSNRRPHEIGSSIGFPKSGGATSQHATASEHARLPTTSPAAPLKKRPKGRWFVTLVIGSLLAFVALNLWNELVRFQAYGELQGVVVHLSPTVSGRVNSTAVEEGDSVQAGQLLAVIDVRELRTERRRMNNELQIALSNLEVRMAEVQSRTRQFQSDQFNRQIEYYKLLGEYHAKRAQLQELETNFATNESLRQSQSISEMEYIAAKAAFESLKVHVDDLAVAVQAIEPALVLALPDDMNELLRAEHSRIAALKTELAEIDQLIEASEVRAPFDGKILKRKCHVGEYVEPNKPVIELLRTDSMEAVVYMPQYRANLLQVGDEIRVMVAPLHAHRHFRVSRISPEILPPPQSLQANYRAYKGTVRVHARPVDLPGMQGTLEELSGWLGAEIGLPRFNYRGLRPDEQTTQVGLSLGRSGWQFNSQARD